MRLQSPERNRRADRRQIRMRGMRSLLALALCVAAVACADELVLTNGDRLTGMLESIVSGKVTFLSDLLGKVTVEVNNVQTFSTDAPAEIHLRDGRVIRGVISASGAGWIAVHTPGATPERVAIEDIASLNPPPKPKPRWKGDVSAGMTFVRSDADTENVNISLTLDRAGEKDRITFHSVYLYGRQRDPATGTNITTQATWYATGEYKYLLPNRFFVYAHSRAEQDRIRSLDMRLIAGLGGGYRWVQRPGFSLFTEAGLSWLREEFSGSPGNESVAGQFAYNVSVELGDRMQLVHKLSVYPNLQDIGDYFLTTELDVRTTLTSSLFLNLKLVFDFDSTPAPGARKDSIKYLLGVGLRF